MTVIVRAETLEEAAAALASNPEARPLGGGTAIQIFRQQGLGEPAVLVDLARIPEMQGISLDDETLRIGAMVTHREVEGSAAVHQHAPLLAATYRHVANVRVRNTATVGGNLAHGDYRLDPPAALMVLGASIEVAGPAGTRTLPLSELFVDLQLTALDPTEVIVSVAVPTTHPRRSTHFDKFSSLAANDWPCAGVAALLEWGEGDMLAGARLGVTALASTPLLIELDGVAGLGEADLAEAAVAAVDAAIDPLPDVRGSAAYKRRIASAVTRDAIAAAWRAEREEAGA